LKDRELLRTCPLCQKKTVELGNKSEMKRELESVSSKDDSVDEKEHFLYENSPQQPVRGSDNLITA